MLPCRALSTYVSILIYALLFTRATSSDPIALATYSSSINSNPTNECIDQSDFKQQNALISTSIININTSQDCNTCYKITCINPTNTQQSSPCNPTTPSITVQIIDNIYPQNPSVTTDFQLTPSTFDYITDITTSNLTSTITTINISYTPTSCDNLVIQSMSYT